MSLMIWVALVIGLLAGWARGGSLAAIGAARVRLLWLVPVPLGAQVALVRTLNLDVPWWVWPVHLMAYLLLATVVLVNRHIPGMALVGVGLAMNASVILVNGGLMPQGPETVHLNHGGEVIAFGQHIPHSKDVLLPRESTRLWWLSDYIVLHIKGWRPLVASPGDFVLTSGLAVIVSGLMRGSTGRDPTLTAPLASWRAGTNEA